jgi:superfamily II DNA or RNA helicase
MVQPEEAENFAKYQVLISDESHTLPANQFSHFCMNVLGHCPYRWFLSATQERNDGRDLLLEGLIGPRVYEKSIKEGIEEGHLAKLSTLIFDVESSSDFISQNAKLMSQRHFYENKDILDIISIIVPDALKQNIPTLILVDEHAQEELIRNRIGKVYEYASGGSDTLKICEDFNQKKIMCVVGTSAVSTGTNFKPTRLTINWQSGKAETKFKQGVIGRSTRLDEGKGSCRLVDFRIKNVPMMLKHANHRIKLYREVGPVEFLEYRK